MARSYLESRDLATTSYGPGETLPTTPKPTHSAHTSTTGLLPYANAKDIIDGIPANWPNPEIPPNYEDPKDPFEDGWKGLLPFAITTKVSLQHPRGKRPLSIRELTSLQGFLLEHRFPPGTLRREVRRQIGNVFPPSVAKVVFESIKRQLLAHDGFDK